MTIRAIMTAVTIQVQGPKGSRVQPKTKEQMLNDDYVIRPDLGRFSAIKGSQKGLPSRLAFGILYKTLSK